MFNLRPIPVQRQVQPMFNPQSIPVQSQIQPMLNSSVPNLNSDPVAQQYNIYSAKPIHPFAYTPEELETLKKYPLYDLKAELVRKKDYSRALDLINEYSYEKDYAELKKYVNNPAFDSLVNSKYYNDLFGFEKLMNTIYELHKTQQDAYKKVTTPGYFCPFLPDVTSMYAGVDVNKCITNLDSFFKSGFSEDLKIFIQNGTSRLSDLWYVTHNLKDIDKTTDVNALLVPYLIM